jgi:thioredoxin:protein disulfide reductase
MAITYAAIGVAAGLTGTLLSAALQNAWVLGAFAGVFVVLSFSMFGFYELQLPTSLQSKLSEESGHLQGGRGIGVFLMGALSALIVGPCVAAPLAGALLYIGQTGDAVLGGTALFVMALGMGAPLIAVGVAGGSLLPRTGPWMEGVKKTFGVLLLATALWLISPVIPGVVEMLGWAALLIITAIYLHALDPLPVHAKGWPRFWKGIGIVMLLTGAALLIGALSGNRDPLQPLAGLRGGAIAGEIPKLAFEPVRSVAELDARLAAVDRPVMLDFYADWCVSCKEMERFTFSDPGVQAKLDGFTLLKADVTANSADDKALLARFGLFGPPGIIFFDAKGQEIKNVRVVGFQNAERFLQSLARTNS